MDVERFSDIFSRMQANLRRMALRIVGNEAEAADAVQEAFLNLWRRRQEVDDKENLEGLVAVSVRNRCVSEIRQRSKHPSGPIDEGRDGLTEPASLSEASGIPSDSSFQSAEEMYAQVEKLMEKYLSERDRRILILRDKYGWDFEEIAENVGMTQAAVRMALSRARKGVLLAYRQRNGSP